MPVCNFQPSRILKLLTKCYCFQYNDSTRYVKQIFILLYLWCALPNRNFSGATFVINIIGHIIRLVGFDKFFNRNAIFLIFCCGNNINSPVGIFIYWLHIYGWLDWSTRSDDKARVNGGNIYLCKVLTNWSVANSLNFKLFLFSTISFTVGSFTLLAILINPADCNINKDLPWVTLLLEIPTVPFSGISLIDLCLSEYKRPATKIVPPTGTILDLWLLFQSFKKV